MAGSLLGKIGGRMATLASGRRQSREARKTANWALFAVGAAAIIIAGSTAWQARNARVETHILLMPNEIVVRDRERADEVARALAVPSLETVLAALRTHLPPEVQLVEASRGEEGTLRLTIDTSDPDALRGALAADRWMARFHERGQEKRDDGTIRVRLAGDLP
jgi:hypothetical protein